MKQTLSLLFAIFLLLGCGSKTTQNVPTEDAMAVSSTDTSSEALENIVDSLPGDASQVKDYTPKETDDKIQDAIARFLKGDKDAVRFAERARQDLYVSTWPEVQCSVEGLLDSPASFKDLVVKKVGPGLYKYECVCPTHGDRYIDCCTISAYIARDEVVVIERIKWDDAVE
jgi:hypothetical protein